MMTCLWLYCAIISFMICISLATTPMTNSNTVSNLEDSCPQILSLCTLNTKDEIFTMLRSQGPKGEKGERGDIGDILHGESGEKGQQGEVGLRGSSGLSGVTGPPGLPGEKGEKSDVPGPTGDEGFDAYNGIMGEGGLIGPKGVQGPAGLLGLTGVKGQPGLPGVFGRVGEEGDVGVSGPIGMPGKPGPNGSCPCYIEETINEDFVFGTEENPGNVVCKATMQPIKAGVYYIGYIPTKVNCVTRANMTTLTCIPPVNEEKLKTIMYKKQGWLSEMDLKIENIYGITRDQLSWIQKRSSSAFQTIRYHCLNSNPFPRDNVEKSLQLLSWNDNTIGPMPTLKKPFFYSVPNNSDGCSRVTSDSEWSYTDIKLVSNSVRRVPVIDFLVKDIRTDKIQKVKIEHIELCFD